MNNFIKIFGNVPMESIIDEVVRNDHLFTGMPDIMKKPGTPGYPHRELRAITLRMTYFKDDLYTNSDSEEQAKDELFAYDLDSFDLFPECRAFVYTLMHEVRASHIGRVCIARIDPGKRVYGHYDEGDSALFYKRYHLMISGEPNNWITCGEGADAEHLEMLTGECWSFNHELWHSFVNHSNSPRIYLNMDLA